MVSETDTRYEIGQNVSVHATVRFVRRGMKRVLIHTKCDPFVAKIVGATKKQIGVYKTSGDNWDAYEEWFEQTNQLFVWKVIRGYFNKSLFVFPNDLKPIEYDYEFPWLWKVPTIWSCKDREALRKDVKTWKRDSVGRFLKQF